MTTISHSPAAAHLLDVTRTVRRAGLRPTGIDRIERAYIEHLIDDPAPLFGLVRTKFGFLLLDKTGCDRLRLHCDHPVWNKSDLVSWVARTSDVKRATTEAGLRKTALDSSVPLRLTNMLRRHLPPGTQYLNVGQTNFNDRVIDALKGGGLSVSAFMCMTLSRSIGRTYKHRDPEAPLKRSLTKWIDMLIASFATRTPPSHRFWGVHGI